MMYCKHCGKEIPENSKFCRYCGNQLTVSNKAHVVAEEAHQVGSERVEYAGFWVRFGAYVADLSGMFLISFLIGVVLYAFLDETTADSLIDSTPDFIYGYFAYAIYNTISLSVFSTTFGKYLYGLSVTTENNESLTFGRSLKRSLLQPLSTLFFGAGYWNMGKNPKNQAWHDKSVGTVVVRKQRNLVFAYIVTLIALIAWAYFAYGLEQ
mgnify:CR=1 FL=1